jgi:hypothetical protein
MDSPIEIILTQLVLWYDATRIQTWPALLAKAEQDGRFASPTELGRSLATERMTDDRHAAAEKVTRNLPGLERKGKRLVLRGPGLLERVGKEYQLSAAGTQLAQSFREAESPQQWLRPLAALLLRRVPHVRALFGLLSVPGATLCFPGGAWFTGAVTRSHVALPDGRVVRPFHGRGPCETPTLRHWMNEHAWWCLGEWRRHEWLESVTDCRYTGALKPDFSLHDVGLALRGACETMLAVGVLADEGSCCRLDHAAARRELGEDLGDDFGWERGTQQLNSVLHLLAQLLPELAADTGFIVTSELRQAMFSHGVQDPDREIAELESQGELLIEAQDYGQSRHGDGLYGDPRKQLIKLRILGGGIS